MKKTYKLRSFALFFTIAITLCFLPSRGSAQELVLNEKINKRAEKVIQANVHKSNGVYTTESLLVTLMEILYSNNLDAYKGKGDNGVVVSFDGKNLGYFAANGTKIVECSDVFKEDGSISGGCEEVAEGYATLYIPYFPNGKYADIYNIEGQKIFTIDLSSKAVCNENNRCDRPLEDGINCPSDCKANQPVIDDSVKQKLSGQTGNTIAQNKEEIKESWWNVWGKLALAAAILVTIAAGVIIAKMGGRRSY